MKVFLSIIGLIILIILGLITGVFIHDFVEEKPDFFNDFKEKLGFENEGEKKEVEIEKEEKAKDLINTNGKVVFKAVVQEDDSENNNKYFEDKKPGEVVELKLPGYIYDTGYVIETTEDREEIDSNNPVGAMESYFSSLAVKDISWFKSLLNSEMKEEIDYSAWNSLLPDYGNSKKIKVKAVALHDKEVIVITEITMKNTATKLCYYYLGRDDGQWEFIEELEEEDGFEVISGSLKVREGIVYNKD